METFTSLLFERPYLQGTVMGTALLVAMAGWWWARYEPASAKRWALATLILAVLGVAGQITASLVTTDRERIEAMLEQAARAVERGDAAAILAMTDEGLVAQGQTREEFARWLEGVFRRVRFHSTSIQRMQVTFAGRDEATAIVSGVATIETEGFSGIATGTYTLEFGRIGGAWKIVAIKEQENPRGLPM